MTRTGSTVFLLAALAGVLSCGGGQTPQEPPPPPPPPPPVAPVPVGSIPAQTLNVGETVRLDVSPYFRDPDGGALTYAAASLAPGVVSVSQLGSVLTMVGVAQGTAAVTVTATDPDRLSVAQSVAVTVLAPNRAPEAVGSIPAQSLDAGGRVTLDVSGYFRDPDGDALTYTASTSAAGVVSVSTSGSSLTIVGVAAGNATVTVTAADPGGLTVAQSAAVTVRASNRAPEAVGSIPAQSLDAGGRVTVDMSGYFRDPDGDALTYTAVTSDAGVASASTSGGSRLTVLGIGPGSANVQVTASDPAGLTATQNVGVTVRRRSSGGFGDGFDDAASLDNWEARNADAEVIGGVLHLTNRVSGSLGLLERSSPPRLNQWSVSARVGRATRQASPGVASLTGHRRFSAARLVLRTLDNGGDVGASADVAGTMAVTGPGGVAADVAAAVSASGSGTGTNYELAIFDAERGWLQITNLSGRSDAVDERANAFTDIELGLDDGDFVAHARRSETGESETLFRVGLDATLDNVPLGDILGEMNGLWLVNQGPVNGTVHIDDVVATGETTSNRAPEAVGSIPAQTLNLEQTRTLDVSGYFRDPDGDVLVYTASSSNPAVATASVSRNRVTVTGVGLGSATVTVTASDAGGLSAAQTMAVTVRAGSDDREALEAFYNATDGPNWRDNTNWLTDAPLGEWYGVSTDASGRVVELDLSGRFDSQQVEWIRHGLNGEIPPELGDLANLRTLYLYGNNLSGSIPSELGNLGNLSYLFLGYNDLSGSIPPELGNLAELTWLRLPTNDLSGSIPPELGNLAELTWLSLDQNNLSGSIPPELGNLASLETLNLAENDLSGSIPSKLGGLANLVVLGLDQNNLSGSIPSELGNLGNLGTASLALNNLSGSIPRELGNLAELTWLSLDQNNLSGSIPSELGNLEELELLALRGNDLSGSLPPELGDLGDLRELYVNDNELAGSLPDSFLNLLLDGFWWYGNAALCAPDTSAFRTWLAEIGDNRPGPFCGGNRPPEVVTSLRIINLAVGRSSAHDMTPRHFRDPDGDTLTFTAVSRNPDIVRGSMAGSVVTVTGVAPGEGVVAVTAADPGGLTATLDVEVMVIEAENRAPEAVGTIPPQTLEPDGETSLNVSSYFRDPDGDTLTYTASSSDTDVVVATMWANDNRVLVLNAGAPGTATVTVTAADPAGLTVTQTVNVTVRATNRSPEAVGTIGHQTLKSGQARTLDVSGHFRDPDGDALTFSTAPNNPGVVSVSMSGSSLTMVAAAAGHTSVSVTATDPAGLSATQNVGVTVVGDLVRLTSNSAIDYEPAWSPDGDQIAFTTDRDGNSEIYVMNASGSGVTRLTDHSRHDIRPSWSPDGDKIAFESERDGNREIYVMNADGSEVTRLTDHSAFDYSPAWSPDGTKIAFVSDRDGNREIYVMNVDGSEATRLTNNTVLDDGPAWSPDGDKIAFSSGREIHVMNADGSGVTRLTNRSRDGNPTWSPDGGRIAFNSQRDGDYEIYMMNADGSGVTRLTNNTALDLGPAWSPDGTRIAFESERDDNREIYVLNVPSTDSSASPRAASPSDTPEQPAFEMTPTRR